jgi:hypothetical protein
MFFCFGCFIQIDYWEYRGESARIKTDVRFIIENPIKFFNENKSVYLTKSCRERLKTPCFSTKKKYYLTHIIRSLRVQISNISNQILISYKQHD